MQNYFLIFEQQKNFLANWTERNYLIFKNKLLTLANVFEQSSQEFISILRDEYSLQWWDLYYGEIQLIKQEINYFAKQIKKLNKPSLRLQISSFGNFFNQKQRFPYGVGFLIFDHLFPISHIVNTIIGALSCNNNVFVKLPNYHQEVTSLIQRIFQQVFDHNYLFFVDEKLTEAKLQSLYGLNFDFIYYNGYKTKGTDLIRFFGPRLIPIFLDLKNKNPMIVDETANLKKAAEQLVFAKLMHNSQTNYAPDYLLVHEYVFSKFLEEIKNAYQRQYPQEDKWKSIAKIETDQHFEELLQAIVRNEKNIKPLFGGDINKYQRKIELTLVQFENLKNDFFANNDYSPILPVLVYNLFADIQGIVEYTNYPNTIFLFSKNKARIKYLQSHLHCRYFFCNDVQPLYLQKLPFGGVKYSGNHLLGKKQSIRLFTYTKKLVKPWWQSKKRIQNYAKKEAYIIKKCKFVNNL